MLIRGDARFLPLADASVNCVVTSPPYFGLRDYGSAGQIGLEPTPDAYVSALVEVFREVRRVLKDDGTVWLNLGDSYSSQAGQRKTSDRAGIKQQSNVGSVNAPSRCVAGLGPKQLIGIPFRVAFALQQPYYAGSIKDERDRVWLAAMLDAKGCMFIHKRKAGQSNGQGYFRQSASYGPGLEIANTSVAVVERIMALVGKGSICSQGPEQTNGRRRQTIYRWNLRTTESREFVRELYPYLVAKQHQARLLYGCPSSGEEADRAHAGLMSLHRGAPTSIDFAEPPTLFEKGWYLRSDIVWSKLNPMPESVTDRPTKAHEYLFLLSKSERYWYDAAAIAEPVSLAMVQEVEQGYEGLGLKDYEAAGVQNPSSVKARIIAGAKRKNEQTGDRRKVGFNDRWDAAEYDGKHGTADPQSASRRMLLNTKANRDDGAQHDAPFGMTRNRRTVWTIPTMPYAGAHFATMPEKLVEPCILAGCPLGGLVLDPFVGSGTVVSVAQRLCRRGVGVDLGYQQLSKKRTRQRGLDFANV